MPICADRTPSTGPTPAPGHPDRLARTMRRATVAAAACGVVLSPIPLADELVLLPAYGLLTATIARSRRLPLRDVPWRPIALTALAGLGARAAVNLTVAYIPVVAAAANAASAAALTGFFGRYVDAACAGAGEGRSTEALGWKEIAEALRPRPANA